MLMLFHVPSQSSNVWLSGVLWYSESHNNTLSDCKNSLDTIYREGKRLVGKLFLSHRLYFFKNTPNTRPIHYKSSSNEEKIVC